jgi:putative ATPase
MKSDLFSNSEDTNLPVRPPLAERMRPLILEDIVGQETLLGEGKFLRQAIQQDQVPSLILWGPPGIGKTTLARVIANLTDSHFTSLSAVIAGVKEVKKVVENATYQQRAFSKRTILFVDEIHRFNKAQQDAFLPHVESGKITLVGATTENPSFQVIAPLLSRCRVVVLERLSEIDLMKILVRSLEDPDKGLGSSCSEFPEEALQVIVKFANGDARTALNALEQIEGVLSKSSSLDSKVTAKTVQETLQHRTLLYDRAGEEHFNLISALHKSLRNSDPDASIYWLVRMLEAGEDPLYIARRLVRFASEDIGLADPYATTRAVSALEAFQFIGLPEGALILAQLAIDLAMAPKSNSVYRAYQLAQQDVNNKRLEPVPLQLRNAPTSLMKDLGYGDNYEHAHNAPEGLTRMACLPENLRGVRYYVPTQRGKEKEYKKRLEALLRFKKSNGISDSEE